MAKLAYGGARARSAGSWIYDSDERSAAMDTHTRGECNHSLEFVVSGSKNWQYRALD